MVTSVRSLWEHRQVLRMLVQRDLQKQYTKYRLGYLWTIIEPLGMSLVLWFVFTALLGPRKLGLQPYLLFLTIAILPWWWFTKGISSSTRIFQRNVNQLRISMLPTELWVLRVLIVTMMEFILSLPIIGIAMLVTRTYPGPLILLYPVAIVLQFLLMYGISLMVSAWVVVVPDLARIVRIVMRAMFYLTPVLYSISNIPERIRPFAALNPVVAPIGLYRIGFWPEEHESGMHYAISFSICAIIIVAGILVFRRLEPRILKEV
jgi:ABC-2 type transport system permease protein